MSFKTAFIFIFIVLNSVFLYAQDALNYFNKELIVISENDNYNLVLKDRYYTNGFFIRFNWLDRNENSRLTLKTIHRTELGQMIFNPYFNSYSLATVLETMDRPYAGWLYGSYGKTKIYNNKDVLMYDGIIGIAGPSALGKETQSLTHKISRLYGIYGWEYQVQNEMGINGSIQYYRSIGMKNSNQHLSLHAVGKAILGNTFTNATAGFLFKAGRLEKEGNSSFWSGLKSRANEKSKYKTEAILFFEPTIMFQAYNATIQGGLFKSDKGLYVSPLNPLIYVLKAGSIISQQRASLSFSYTLRQREAKSMFDKMEIFGAIALSYRFR